MNPVIFLSHSGLDDQFALRFSEDLGEELRLRAGGERVHIFNTSGSDRLWGVSDEQLKDYLLRNLEKADIYLLLVTPQSLKSNSEWIRFEMLVADRFCMAEGRRSFFIPCAALGASLGRLPEPASKFMGIELDATPRSLDELAHKMIAIMERERSDREQRGPRPPNMD